MARLPVVGSDDGTWGTILNDYLSQQHGAGGEHLSITVPGAALATTDVFSAKISTDTNYRYIVNADGGLEWGAGGISATDVNLYRSAADTLKTDDAFQASSVSIGGDPTTSVKLKQDLNGAGYPGIEIGGSWIYRNNHNDWLRTNDNFAVDGLIATNGAGGGLEVYNDFIYGADGTYPNIAIYSGSIQFGPGTIDAPDTNLYRSAANTLKTDDEFHSAADITARPGGTTAVSIGAKGPASEAGITLYGDTNLYRSAANTLKTDDDFISGSAISALSGYVKAVSPSAASVAFDAHDGATPGRSFIVRGDGQLLWGATADPGSWVGDTNLYRSEANTIKTDDNIQAVGSILARAGAAGQVQIGESSGTPNIMFGLGGSQDTNLYRSAANTLATDDTFVAVDVRGHLMTLPFSKSGGLTVTTGTHRLYAPNNTSWTITHVRASVGTAPTGASLIVDVHKNGTTIFTTQTNRPTIAASGFTDIADAIEVTTLTNGDYLTVDIDQVGATIAGSDLTVEITLRRA